MTRVTVEFQRIGRAQNAPGGGPLVLNIAIATKLDAAGQPVTPEFPALCADIEERVTAFAKKYISSRFFDVDAYDDGKVSIENGRYGVGEWRIAPEVTP